VAKVAIQIVHHSIVGARMLLTFRGRSDHKGSGKRETLKRNAN
jgi:hypothetical protein